MVTREDNTVLGTRTFSAQPWALLLPSSSAPLVTSSLEYINCQYSMQWWLPAACSLPSSKHGSSVSQASGACRNNSRASSAGSCFCYRCHASGACRNASRASSAGGGFCYQCCLQSSALQARIFRLPSIDLPSSRHGSSVFRLPSTDLSLMQIS